MNLQIDPAKVAAKLDAAGVPAGVREHATVQVLDMLGMSMARRLEDELSDDELVEFQQFAENPEPEAGTTWLLQRFPNYGQMVDEELADIVADLKKSVDDAKTS